MKLESWISQCLKKAKYRSESKARAIMKKNIDSGKASYLRCYYCNQCFSYHITHLQERKKELQ